MRPHCKITAFDRRCVAAMNSPFPPVNHLCFHLQASNACNKHISRSICTVMQGLWERSSGQTDGRSLSPSLYLSTLSCSLNLKHQSVISATSKMKHEPIRHTILTKISKHDGQLNSFRLLTTHKNMYISSSLLRLPYRVQEAIMPLPRLAAHAHSAFLKAPRRAQRVCGNVVSQWLQFNRP